MSSDDVDWIVEKAAELLIDKVEDGPLKEEDINLAYQMFVEPRLRKISDSFSDVDEYTEATNEIRIRLHEIADELNRENWGDER